MRKRSTFFLLLTGLLFATPRFATAQSYSITWYKIAGGGGTSSGGNYSLSGTIGQPDAGQMSGGGYSLTGGFWSIIAAIQLPNSPVLSLTRSNAFVVISWPATPGFTLQSSANLAAPTVWSVVTQQVSTANGTNSVSIPITGGNQFFRLQ
jgi:hypothetical protein